MVDISTDLIAIDHEVVCCNEGFEDDHPAGVGGPLKQGVSQLRNVHIHLVGTVDEIYKGNQKKKKQESVRYFIPHNNQKKHTYC